MTPRRFTLCYVGNALCLVGYPEEGERYTGRAVCKAPGSGMSQLHHGIALYMLNRPEEALSHLKTADRLMPGSHLWMVKTWQSGAYRDLGRLAEADAARDKSFSLNPTHAFDQVFKALLCVHLERDADARRCIQTARRLGMELALAERLWRRAHPNSPTREHDIAIVRKLYAATEPRA